MATVINLGKVRKQQRRSAVAVQAVENSVRHGRTKAEKLRDRLAAEHAARVLDQAVLDQEPGDRSLGDQAVRDP